MTIYGQSFTVLAPGDPREILDVATEVDKLMASIASQTGVADTSRVALLAALHLADQLRTSRAETEAVRERVEEGSRRLGQLLDQLPS